VITSSRHSGPILMTDTVIMTDAAKLNENVIDFSICFASNIKTIAAPAQVEAPARKESNRGNFQSSAALVEADAMAMCGNGDMNNDS
jgi:hypothetical protein